MTALAHSRDRRALSGLVCGIAFVAGIGAGQATSKAPYPPPGSDAQVIRAFFRDNAFSARINAAGQLISAASLAQFTPSVMRLARRADPASRALPAAAAIGGTAAAAAVTASALYTAALTTPRSDNDDAAVALSRRAFLSGGVAHGVGFGLLVGVISLSGSRTGAVARAAGKLALGSAVANLLTPLYFAADEMAWLIPVGRFTGLIVTGLTAIRLARHRD